MFSPSKIYYNIIVNERNGDENVRDVKRIKPFLEKIGEIWERECPDWRFGQLIYNFLHEDPFYWEEDEFLRKLEEYFKEDK